MIRRRLCIAAVALSAVAGTTTWSPRVALAGDDDTAAIEMARQRFQEGVRYFDAKQYDKARAAFLQAYALKKHPTVLLNLAQSELRSAHDAEAAEHFAEYLRENRDAGASERQSAEQGLASAKARVAEVSLAVDLPDAEVFVDNDSRGHAPLPGPVYLSPGTHTLQARKEGKVATSTVTASAGQSVSVALNFSNVGRTATPRPETTAAAQPTPPPPPQPEVEPRPTGVESSATTEGSIEPGGTRSFGAWYAHRPLAWVFTGVGGIGLAGGVGFAISANRNYKDADSVASQIDDAAKINGIPTQGLCVNSALLSSLPPARADAYRSACQKYKDNVDRGDTMKTLATVSAAVGGAFLVGTVVYYFVDRGSGTSQKAQVEPVPSLRFSPVIAPGMLGISAGASF